jgi:hypothetical protein
MARRNRGSKKGGKAITTVEVNDYDMWMVNEYDGQYSLCDCWEGKDGDIMPNFCTIENFKTGKEMQVPKGLSGRFDSLEELNEVLGKLYGKIKRHIERGEGAADEPPY